MGFAPEKSYSIGRGLDSWGIVQKTQVIDGYKGSLRPVKFPLLQGDFFSGKGVITSLIWGPITSFMTGFFLGPPKVEVQVSHKIQQCFLENNLYLEHLRGANMTLRGAH